MKRSHQALFIALLLTCARMVDAQLPRVETIEGDCLGFPVPIPKDSLTPVDGFRSYDALRMRFDSLWLAQEHISRLTVGKSTQGREIHAYRFTTEVEETPEGTLKSAAVLQGAMHSNEWAAAEATAGVFEWLAGEPEDDPVLSYLLEHAVVVVSPLANPDGLVQTQTYFDKLVVDSDRNAGPCALGWDGRQHRKNMRDVDTLIETLEDYRFGVNLNNNHEPGFGLPGGTQSGSQHTNHTQYHGTMAGSEPESQALYNVADFAQIAGLDRIRFYADVHAPGPSLFTSEDGRILRDAVENQVANVMARVSGRYSVKCVAHLAGGSCAAPIGATDEYFLHTYGCVSMTPEVGASGQSSPTQSLIHPDNEIDFTREEFVQMTRAALYFMAGPPFLSELAIYETAALESGESTPVYHEERVYDPESGERRRILEQHAPLQASRYTLVLRFNKPMRLQDEETQTASVFNGQVDVTPQIVLGSAATATELAWAFDAPGEPLGYGRYAGDTLIAQLDLMATRVCSGKHELYVLVGDLTGLLLDADPRSVVDWTPEGWSGYQNARGDEDAVGGPDTIMHLVVQNADSESCFDGTLTPWEATDVGATSVPGSTLRTGDCFALTAAGGNIVFRNDRFHFLYQPFEGDFSLEARVEDWVADSRGSKLGLMARGSLEQDADSASVVLEVRGDLFRHRFLRRESAGGTLRATSHDEYGQPNVWLRLERQGKVLSGSLSPDGELWLEPDTIELPELPHTVFAGIASTWVVSGPSAHATICDLTLSPNQGPVATFLRGDCDGDGNPCSGVNDALELLSWLFLGRTAPPCLAACDPDGNGELELADAVYGLNFCFKGAGAPVAPFPECGPGVRTDTPLACETSNCP